MFCLNTSDSFCLWLRLAMKEASSGMERALCGSPGWLAGLAAMFGRVLCVWLPGCCCWSVLALPPLLPGSVLAEFWEPFSSPLSTLLPEVLSCSLCCCLSYFTMKQLTKFIIKTMICPIPAYLNNVYKHVQCLF